MEHVTVTLPSAWSEFVDSAVAAGGYKDAAEYVRSLLREDLKRREFERIEKLIQEGIDSGPAVEWTDEDWDDIRREVHELYAKRTGKTQ